MGNKTLHSKCTLRRIKVRPHPFSSPTRFRTGASWCFKVMLGKGFPSIQNAPKLSSPCSAASGIGHFLESGYKELNWNLKDWDQKLCLYEDVLTFFPINQDLHIAGKVPSEHLEVFSLNCRDTTLWVHRDSPSHKTAKSPQIPRASIVLSSDN